MESKNKQKEEMDYEKRLKNLECPFTWDMNKLDKATDLQYHPNDDEEFFPLLQLLRNIMTVYVDTKADEDSKKILENLEKCDDNMIALKKKADPEISIDVANYVLQATQCFVFYKLEMKDKLKKILADIKNVETMNKKEISTLKACRSICWSKYHRIGSYEAEKFIRQAIDENPNCDLWHFILAKNLRRERRDSTLNSKPSSEETASFLKAYQISKNPVYGIFVAQMYRESRNNSQASQIYKNIFSSDPECITVLLRMALGFIQLRDFDRAKVCLAKIAEKCPKHSMYLHYQGIYHLKQNQYKEAVVFLKEAIKDYNIPAEKQYLQCMVKVDKTFNTTKYLLNMLDRYQNLPEYQLQPIILDLAFSYWKRDNNVKEALKHFLRAIEIDPEAKCLTDYFTNNIVYIKDRNIFHILKRDLLPTVERRNFNVDTVKTTDSLKKYCKNYFDAQFKSTEDSFTQFSLKN